MAGIVAKATTLAGGESELSPKLYRFGESAKRKGTGRKYKEYKIRVPGSSDMKVSVGEYVRYNVNMNG